MHLLDLLKRREGKTLEFKRDLSSPDGALKSIVAFANTAGGTLLLGVEDRTGHVRGVEDALDLEERLANTISDSIAPRLAPDIEERTVHEFLEVISLERRHPNNLRRRFKLQRPSDSYREVGSAPRDVGLHLQLASSECATERISASRLSRH
jgi:predicted HTH transcriptional regulator